MEDIIRTKNTITDLQAEYDRQAGMRQAAIAKRLYPHQAQKQMALGEVDMKANIAPWIRAFLRDQAKRRQHKDELVQIKSDVKEMKAANTFYD